MKIQFVLRSASLSIMFATIAACSQPDASSSSGSGAGSTATTSTIETCSSCGVVRSITPVTQDGRSSGAGAAIGAVVGGVAGNQVGGGSGQRVATVAGVVGGALLGNTIEQNRNATTVYTIVVDMEDGGQQSVTVPDPLNITPGAAVNVHGDNISLR